MSHSHKHGTFTGGTRVNVSLTRAQAMKLRVIRDRTNADSNAETVRFAIEQIYKLHAAGAIDLASLQFDTPLTLEEKKEECQSASTASPDSVTGWLYPNRNEG